MRVMNIANAKERNQPSPTWHTWITGLFRGGTWRLVAPGMSYAPGIKRSCMLLAWRDKIEVVADYGDDFFIWGFPKMGIPPIGWFIMGNFMKLMIYRGTPISGNSHVSTWTLGFPSSKLRIVHRNVCWRRPSFPTASLLIVIVEEAITIMMGLNIVTLPKRREHTQHQCYINAMLLRQVTSRSARPLSKPYFWQKVFASS